MQLEYGPRYEKFRQEVRTFLEKNVDRATRGPLLGRGNEVSSPGSTGAMAPSPICSRRS
jgi:hypothetical protein